MIFLGTDLFFDGLPAVYLNLYRGWCYSGWCYSQLGGARGAAEDYFFGERAPFQWSVGQKLCQDFENNVDTLTGRALFGRDFTRSVVKTTGYLLVLLLHVGAELPKTLKLYTAISRCSYLLCWDFNQPIQHFYKRSPPVG